MDRGEREEVRAPLLCGVAEPSPAPARRKNSVRFLKKEFLSKLPAKIRSAVHTEDPSRIDISRAEALSTGEKEYYEKQFATLKSFEEVDSLNESTNGDNGHEDQENADQKQSELAMKISNYANLILLSLKIYATIRSGSIAIAASTLDSFLDLIAGGILWFTHLSMKNVNIYQYPIGKLRMQPVGIVVFAAVMATLVSFYYVQDFRFWFRH